METIRKDGWTAEEDAIILDNAAQYKDREMMELLPGRTLIAIRQRRVELGIKRQLPPKWTKKEDAIIARNFPQKSDEEISALLVNRPPESVRIRRYKLGLKRIPTKRTVNPEKNYSVRLTRKQKRKLLLTISDSLDRCKENGEKCECEYCLRARKLNSVFDNPSLYEKIKPELELLP